MSIVAAATLASVTEIEQDAAHLIAAELSNRMRLGTLQTLVYSGLHRVYGAIYVVIPCMGQALLLPEQLPIASQNIAA